MSEKPRRKKPLRKRSTEREWSNTPSVNPRYKGATPADVARALLGKPVCHPAKVADDTAVVKPNV